MYCNFCPKLFTSEQGIRKHCDCKHKLPEGIKIGPQKASFGEEDATLSLKRTYGNRKYIFKISSKW